MKTDACTPVRTGGVSPGMVAWPPGALYLQVAHFHQNLHLSLNSTTNLFCDR